MRNRLPALCIFLTILTRLLVTMGCSPTSSTSQYERPNMIVVLVDALRRDHLGLYGYDKPTSPFLDSMASNGLVFDDAWSQGSQTIFSTASMFTSQFFAPIAFVPTSRLSSTLTASVDERAETLKVLVSVAPAFPAVLSESGYHTAAFLNNPHHHRHSGFPDIFDEAFLLIDGEDFQSTKTLLHADGREMVRRAIEWLALREQSAQPYLIYLHLMDVHNPYRPPAEFEERFVTTVGTDRYQNAIPTKEDMPSAADLQFMMESYDAEIAYVDTLISDMHTAAEAIGSKPLVMVVTSDHGDEFLDHGGLGHGRTLEMELLRVPLIVFGDGITTRREEHLVRLVDVGPSLLEMAGVTIPQDWDGKPVFRSMPKSVEVTESIANYRRLMSLTTVDWHSVWDRGADSIVLYDRRDDPRGLIDVASTSPDIVRIFRERFSSLARERAVMLRSLRESMDDLVNKLNSVQIGVETEEQLRALGYVD